MAGSIEESGKANVALAAVFPIMLALMLTIIMLQIRSFSATSMVVLTAPLGVVGVVSALLLFHQPFGFNAILGLIGLAGISMRNTLILIGQIHTNQEHGLDPYRAVVEATVQRARPRDPDRARRRTGLHSPHAIRVLGLHGLHPYRRHGRRNGPDPDLPARTLCYLVPHAASGDRSGRSQTEAARRRAPAAAAGDTGSDRSAPASPTAPATPLVAIPRHIAKRASHVNYDIARASSTPGRPRNW
jgi:hypothetical protein